LVVPNQTLQDATVTGADSLLSTILEATSVSVSNPIDLARFATGDALEFLELAPQNDRNKVNTAVHAFDQSIPGFP